MSTIIETERLILRKFTPDDYKGVFEFGSNPEVQRYTGNPNLETLNEAKDLISNVWLKDYATYGYGRLAAIYKPDNKIIGFAGIKYLPEFDAVDLGYRFLPEYWGKGIATEVSEAIIEYVFSYMNINRLIAMVMPENPASSRVLEKVGFTHFKTAPYEEGEPDCLWFELEKTYN